MMLMSIFAVAAVLGLLGANFQEKEWGPPPPVAPYGNEHLPNDHVVIPLIFPVLGPSRWDDGYDEGRGAFRHTGIDIRAAKMTPIVAPFSGTIGIKPMTFWIYGDDGWAMLGTHLNDDDIGRHNHDGSRDVMFAPDVAPGQHVYAGQFIGYVGESGDATAPHLHFEIYAPGAGPTKYRIRNPYPSLKAARIIKTPIYSMPSPEARPHGNEIRLVACVRLVEPDPKRVTVILVAKQYQDGHVAPVTNIHFIRLKPSDRVIQEIGGWTVLAKLPATRTINIYVPLSSKLDDSTVRSIDIPPPN